VILNWLRSGGKAEKPKTQRECLRDVYGATSGFTTFVGAKPLAAITRYVTRCGMVSLEEILKIWPSELRTGSQRLPKIFYIPTGSAAMTSNR
jgi:hypothetical protein